MTDASRTATYGYDSLDRLTMKATPEGTLNYTYDASNNLATASYPNTVQANFGYDTLNRLTGQTSRLGNYSYQLGPTGNRTSGSEQSGRSVIWNYDGIYRLTSETITGDPSHANGSVAYDLDPVGNRLSINSTIPGVSSGSFSFNGDNLMGGESYDANGNTTATGGKTYGYDSENRLKSMNGGAVTLVYDGDGNRVAKTVNGVTTRYLVDDLNPTGYAQVIEESVNGSVQRAYSYGLQRIDVIQLVNNTWTLSFYGYDGFGNVRQLTNATGAVTDTYAYDAFGNLLNKTGTVFAAVEIIVRRWDTDLNLYYLRARYYNPSTGRFMSRDPYDGDRVFPISLHKYLYAGSNPVNYVDPRGRALFEYAIESSAAIPEARLISIYGCVGDAGLAAADLILDNEVHLSTALGGASTVIGCVLLTPGLSELAEEGNKIVKSAEFIAKAAGWGACALDAEDFINGLNGLLSGRPDGVEIGKSIESLVGCVGDLLGDLIAHPGAPPQSLGLQ